MAGSIEYDSNQKYLIHQLTDALFNEDELEQFCQEHFQGVTNRLTADMAKAQKIQTLIETCAQYSQLGKLVIQIKKSKPEAYQEFVGRVQETTRGPKRDDSRRAADPTVTSFPIEPASSLSLSGGASRRGIIHNAEELLSHSLADRYQIDEILDKSGLGAVFKAYDTKLQLDVAIKVINLTQVDEAALRERVRQEVRTAMQLDHPGIVQVYDLGEADSILYIIMEFIPGYNLRQARQYFNTIDKRIALPQILKLMRQLCLTVDYMHQQRVLHPGTKPENIMLKQGQAGEEATWRPVLINLGLLRPNQESLRAHKVSTRRLTYSVSPELLLGHGTDIRSDVYALGVVMYDLLVGQPPFRPRDPAEATHQHIETPVTPPSLVNADIPAAVEAVVQKALAKNPADRYLSAREMAQALAECPASPTSTGQPRLEGAAADIVISVDDQPLMVAPGTSVTTTLTLHNEGVQERHCKIKIQDIPAEWVSISPSAVSLAGGQTETVTVAIQPPLSPQSRAGRHSMSIQLIRQRDNREIRELKKILTVTPYSQFNSSLWPRELTGDQATEVTVENQGNSTELFTIRPKQDQGIKFEPEQQRLKLAAGESGSAPVQVTARQPWWLSQPTSQTFTLQVISPQGKVDTHTGQVTSQPAVSPKWILGAIAFITLALCGLMTFYFSVNLTPGAATQTAEWAATQAQQQTATGQAAIVQLAQTRTAATRAATQTAEWYELDSDGDDLTNRQEQALNTNPNNPDSDGDGLFDGKEVNLYKTDARDPDTDSDGLSDGEEIRQGLDPLKTDSDDDGTPDGVDSDPSQPPTPTATLAPTPTGERIVGVQFDPQQFGLPQAGQRPRYEVREDQEEVTISLILTAPASERVIVDYNTRSFQARSGSDYEADQGNLVFETGQTRADFSIRIREDTQSETSEIFLLELSTPNRSPVQIDTPTAEILILDND